MIKIITITLLAVFSLLQTGCTGDQPTPSTINIGGVIDSKVYIPKCGNGYAETWAEYQVNDYPEVEDGKLYVHKKGTGIKQKVCKDNGKYYFFLDSAVYDKKTFQGIL